MQCILKSPGYCSEENSLNFEINAHRHLGEYQYCFNRRFDLADMIFRLNNDAAQTDKRPGAWSGHA